MKTMLIVEMEEEDYQQLIDEAYYYDQYFEEYLIDNGYLNVFDLIEHELVLLHVVDIFGNLVSVVNLDATRQKGHYLKAETKLRLGLPLGIDLWEWFNCYSEEWRKTNA